MERCHRRQGKAVDGGVFAFGTAAFAGSLEQTTVSPPVVAATDS
jgi:hypothetical protein